MSLIAMKISELIGNTPLLPLRRLNIKEDVTIYVKLESQNPGGSVKDRPALQMILAALKRGTISEGDKIIEPTSGNTGIALAMIAQEMGLDLTLIMPETATAERIYTTKAYGARVILRGTSSEHCRTLAKEMVLNDGYKSLNQYDNPDNTIAHYQNTGPEIWRDTHHNVTHFVSAMGSSGTIMGVSKFLKEKNPTIQVYGTKSLDGPKIPGMSNWSPGFEPKIYNNAYIDGIIPIAYDQSIDVMKKLALKESIFSGPSSGGNVAAALQLADKIDKGVIVTIICDRGDRYLSSGLYQDILEKQLQAFETSV